MRAKGALHIHSQLSHDGTLTIAELASWYRGKGYQFLAMGEHAEDLAAAFLQQRGLKLVARNYRCRGGELDSAFYVEVVDQIHCGPHYGPRASRQMPSASASLHRITGPVV